MWSCLWNFGRSIKSPPVTAQLAGINESNYFLYDERSQSAPPTPQSSCISTKPVGPKGLGVVTPIVFYAHSLSKPQYSNRSRLSAR